MKEKDTIKIDRSYRDSTAPTCRRYDGRPQAQAGLMELDEEGNVTVGYDPEIGDAVPMHVWHGRTRRFHIPNDLTVHGVDKLIDTVEADLQIVYDDLEISWNGSNIVGKLSEAGEDAELQIEDAIFSMEWDEGDYWNIMNVSEYLNGLDSPEDFDESVSTWTGLINHAKAIADTLICIAESEGIYLIGDVEEYIRRYAANAIEQEDAE